MGEARDFEALRLEPFHHLIGCLRQRAWTGSGRGGWGGRGGQRDKVGGAEGGRG